MIWRSWCHHQISHSALPYTHSHSSAQSHTGDKWGAPWEASQQSDPDRGNHWVVPPMAAEESEAKTQVHEYPREMPWPVHKRWPQRLPHFDQDGQQSFRSSISLLPWLWRVLLMRGADSGAGKAVMSSYQRCRWSNRQLRTYMESGERHGVFTWA